MGVRISREHDLIVSVGLHDGRTSLAVKIIKKCLNYRDEILMKQFRRSELGRGKVWYDPSEMRGKLVIFPARCVETLPGSTVKI